jgi:hypothetical protein
VGTIKAPPPVQYFVSLIFNSEALLRNIETDLVALLGQIQERTSVQPFLHSDYYEKEMGRDLSRYFILFVPLASREQLPGVKLRTNEIELAYARNGSRTVNIDPGYVAPEQVVLATTKGYAHRIYLRSGIFADLTLIFENGSYHGLPWTYPDYGSQEIIALCNQWKRHYKESLRCQKA